MWGTHVLYTLFTGEATAAVKIKAYIATGYVCLGQDNILRGTRLLFICDVEGLPEGNVVINYKWYQNCSTRKCEIREGHPYYTAVNGTLLVDTTSWEGRPRRHICEVKYQSDEGGSNNLSGNTSVIRLTGKSIHKTINC